MVRSVCFLLMNRSNGYDMGLSRWGTTRETQRHRQASIMLWLCASQFDFGSESSSDFLDDRQAQARAAFLCT